MRILVVDDHPDSARILSVLLTALGHETREAMSGTAALALVETYVPELAFLDIGLPDISGFDVARALRERFGPSLYLVAITGWGQPEDIARAFAAGFDKHVLKPIDVPVLRQILAERSR